MRKSINKIIPKPEVISSYKTLKPLARWISEPALWQLNRRSASTATFIGLFCAFLPIPTQMIIAAPLSIIFRCNLPLSIAWVWVSNPITMPPMLYFSYRLGSLMLDLETQAVSIELTWKWFASNIETIVYPLLVGSIICAWVAGITGFFAIRILWRLSIIRRWRNRHPPHA